MKINRIVFAIIGLLSAGCSMDAKLVSLSPSTGVVFDPLANAAKTTGLVSGSQQTGTAGSGAYHVQSSLGSYVSGMKHTTSGGYTVYSSVQGSIVNESSQ